MAQLRLSYDPASSVFMIIGAMCKESVSLFNAVDIKSI